MSIQEGQSQSNNEMTALVEQVEHPVTNPVEDILESDEKKGNTSLNSSSDSVQKIPEEVKEEKRKILEQVEYYFGDRNLPKDKFLKELCGKDPSGRGWVPISIIRQFRKMQVYKDDTLIVEALRESPELLEVDETSTKVRRKTPIQMSIPEHIIESPMWSSIYAKGFDPNTGHNLQTEVTNFFNKFGKVVRIRERLDEQNNFKGSFFIQFSSHEEAKKISEMDLEFKGTQIKMMMKFDYCEMKCIEKGLDPNTMRKQEPRNHKNVKLKNKEPRYEKDCLIKYEGVGPNVTWEDVRKKFDSDYGKVVFVQLSSTTKSGTIQFEKAIAEKVVASIKDDLEFDGVKPKISVMTGQEEKDYYQKRLDYFRDCIARKREKGGAKKHRSQIKRKKGQNNLTQNKNVPEVLSASMAQNSSAPEVLSTPVEQNNSTPEVLSTPVEQNNSAPEVLSTPKNGEKRKLDNTEIDDSPKETKTVKLNSGDAIESLNSS
ncbi:3064_t:CDS:2 [Diversispora eburnea]|uniref:3064_t:CDS:1 n=1 Tax=Diversispora eburnea TaxID=1213867 RepID=A0A9N8V208_9GLOM|nr:3064_t:CDS:2 [Diversispora eburnea]